MNYPAFNNPPGNKCEKITLILPEGNSVTQRHMPCFGRPKVMPIDSVSYEAEQILHEFNNAMNNQVHSNDLVANKILSRLNQVQSVNPSNSQHRKFNEVSYNFHQNQYDYNEISVYPIIKKQIIILKKRDKWKIYSAWMVWNTYECNFWIFINSPDPTECHPHTIPEQYVIHAN